jgi:hypothetical protein
MTWQNVVMPLAELTADGQVATVEELTAVSSDAVAAAATASGAGAGGAEASVKAAAK